MSDNQILDNGKQKVSHLSMPLVESFDSMPLWNFCCEHKQQLINSAQNLGGN